MSYLVLNVRSKDDEILQHDCQPTQMGKTGTCPFGADLMGVTLGLLIFELKANVVMETCEISWFILRCGDTSMA